MARIKKDKNSWKAGGVLHRDNRHDKSVDGSSAPTRKKKKNTNKWCKGVEGRHHVPVWQESKFMRHWHSEKTMEVACGNCGKVFETDFVFAGRPKQGREALMAKWQSKLNPAKLEK